MHEPFDEAADILANAGGVNMSSFERVQNLQWLFWYEAEFFQKEEKVQLTAAPGARPPWPWRWSG